MKSETVPRRRCEKSVFSNIGKLYCVISADGLVFSPEVSWRYRLSALNIDKILNLFFQIYLSFIILNVFVCSRIITFKEPRKKLWKHQCYKWIFIISAQSLSAWPNGKFAPFDRRWVCSYVWEGRISITLIQINTFERVYDAYNCSVRLCLLYLFDHNQLLACASI